MKYIQEQFRGYDTEQVSQLHSCNFLSNQVYVRMVYGNFIDRKKYQTTATLDGGKFSGVPWVSGLIEGRGRMYDPETGRSI